MLDGRSAFLGSEKALCRTFCIWEYTKGVVAPCCRQMTSVKLRESKFGQALVIETHVRSGGYILGEGLRCCSAQRTARQVH